MGWWKKMSWKKKVLFGVLGAFGVGAIVAVTVFAAPAWIGILGGAAVVASTMGVYNEYLNRKDIENQRQRRALDTRIDAAERRAAEREDRIRILQNQVETAERNNQQLEENNNKLKQDNENAQEKIDAKDIELAKKNRLIDDKQRKIDELGGNGTSIQSDSRYYYSSNDVNSCLHQAVLNRLGGFAKDCQYLLTQDVMSSLGMKFKTLLFPAINSSLSGLSRLISLLNSNELSFALTHITAQNGVKIVFPYLDLTNRHWNSAEWQIAQTEHGYTVTCYLYNPRGGKDNTMMNEEMRMAVETKLCELMPQKEVEFKYPPNPFQTCRQSKPDKISCGPIVAKEIELRILEQSLDRTIPYEFGAWEIVAAQQSETASIKSLAKSRYHFLSADRITALEDSKQMLEVSPLRLV